MADRAGDRALSPSSSLTEADNFDDEKGANGSSSYVKVKAPEEMEMGTDIERAELLQPVDQQKSAEPEKSSVRTAVIWMVVNTLATIGIVCRSLTVRDRNADTYAYRSLRIRRFSKTSLSNSLNCHSRRSISS
jgi:hypothetical protein